MTELVLTVLLQPDEEDPAILNVSVPGLPGCISTLGAPNAAVVIAQGALERALLGMGEGERRDLMAQQAAVRPSALPPGSRMERVTVRAPLPDGALLPAR